MSFILFIALCASAAYWILQLWRPPVRPVAAPVMMAADDVPLDAAAGLFGGRPSAVGVASNYQLKGVVVAANGRDSVAILSADGKPAQAVRLNTEFQPGVMVREVHPQYILLSEGGVIKRVPLPEVTKAVQQASFNNGGLPPFPAPQLPVVPQMPVLPQMQTAPQMPVQVVNPPQAEAPGQAMYGQDQQDAPPTQSQPLDNVVDPLAPQGAQQNVPTSGAPARFGESDSARAARSR